MKINELLTLALHRRGLRKKSLSTYKTKVDKFCQYCAKNKVYRLERITRDVCERFLDGLTTKSSTTRNSYRTILHTLFSDIVEDGKMKQNPFHLVKRHSENKQGKMYFSTAQIHSLSLTISSENKTLWMACKMLYYCFIRNTELCNLPLQDVNIEDGVIVVHGSFSKNKKTQAVIIPDQFKDDCERWYNQQKAIGSHYFISKQDGTKIAKGDWFNEQHQKAQKAHGLGKRYSFYSWKHSGAVQFYKNTKDLKALQMQLRHHSLDQVDEYLRELGIMETTTIKTHQMPVMLKMTA